MEAPVCCTPRAEGGSASPQTPPSLGARRVAADAVAIPGGEALVGTNTPMIPGDEEGPPRRVRVKPFLIGATAITNADFAAFVEATGHRTDAERFGWSFVFHNHVPPETGETLGVAGAEWWRRIEGACWHRVDGHTPPAPDHPVVHVSWHDARAYAAWVGGRLPSEAEWEHAARGGLGEARFPWGDREPDEADFLPCNIWQGRFPHQDTGADGFTTTAPARAFEPNGFGLYNMVGNVWEWTAEPFRLRSIKREAKARAAAMRGFKLIKGGSFLCHHSYCTRYRIAARTGNSPDSTTAHTGFRVVWDEASAR